jgi:hypothetical protein
VRPYLKNNLKEKGLGGLAQMVEHWPSKHKTLNSKPSITKTNIHTHTQTFLRTHKRTGITELIIPKSVSSGRHKLKYLLTRSRSLQTGKIKVGNCWRPRVSIRV